jgi:hypothetical protein
MRQLLNPYPDVRPDHPMIVREMRRLRWLKRAGSLRRYSLLIFLRVIGIVLVLFLILLFVQWRQDRDLFGFWRIGGEYFVILVGVSLLANLLLDFGSITAALNSISGEITNGTWDLLRLTGIREGELVLAKHMITQIRVWRTTMWVIGLRIAATLIAIIATLTVYFFNTSFSEYRTFQENVVFFLFNIIPLMGLFCIFILEPLWRMRAMTALGMVISVRTRDNALAVLLSVAMVLALWLMQAVVIAAVVVGLWVLAFVLSAGDMLALCAPLTTLLLIFSVVYGFYSILKTWGLRQVTRRLFTLT